MVPYVKANLQLNEAELGLILLAFGMGALITMPLTGWLVHRFGSRTIVFFAGFCMIGLLPSLPLAPSASMLSFFLFLFGASNGALNVSINAQAVIVEKQYNQGIMSGFHCLFSAGGLVGAAGFTFLLEMGFSLAVCAFWFSVAMLIVLFWQFRNLLPGIVDTDQKAQKTRLRGKIFLLGALCFIAFLTEGSMLDWSAVFLRSVHELDPAIAGMGYAAFSVAMAIGRYTGDRLIRYMGPVATLQLGSALAALGIFIAVNYSWMHMEMVGFVLVGLGASNIVPILFSNAGKQAETSPGIALAVVTTFGYTGLLLGPAVIGFVAQATNLSIALTGVAGLMLLVGVCGNLIRKQAAEPTT